MQKKNLTLLVLLITAVTGAWAQDESHWPDFNSGYYDEQGGLVAAIQIDGVTITSLYEGWEALEIAFFAGDECRGNNYYLYNGYVEEYGDPFPILDGAPIYCNNAGEQVSVKMYDHINGILYEDCVVTLQGEPLTILTGDEHFEGWDDPENPVILSFTTPESSEPEAPAVTPTGNKNEWTFTMPDYDIELEVEYETALALNEVDDNAEKLEEWNGYEADVTLTRTLNTGGWNTLTLPFAISAADVATLKSILGTQSASIGFKELVSSTYDGTTLALNFADATEIKAGQPYLVKTSQAVDFATLPATIDAAIAANSLPISNPFKDVIVSKDPVPTVTDAVDFIPTLGKTLVTGPADDLSNPRSVLFITGNNTVVFPSVVNQATDQSSYMKGFRAYFQLKGEAATARTFALNLGDGETTSITTTNDTNDTNSVYDLQGRRVDKAAQKGVYIQNGKKVVVK